MCFCCLSVLQHAGTRTVFLKTSATWAKGRLPPVFDHCPVYLIGSVSVCMFLYVCAYKTHAHFAVGFSAICWHRKRWTKEIRATRGTCSSAFPSQPWLTLSHPTMMFLFWFFSVSALLSPIRFSLPVKSLPSSFPSSLLWTVHPHPRLLTQLHFPLTESLLPYSFFTSIPLLYSHLAPDELFAVSLLVQTVPALSQSSPPKMSLNPPGCLCRPFRQLQSSALSHPNSFPLSHCQLWLPFPSSYSHCPFPLGSTSSSSLPSSS